MLFGLKIIKYPYAPFNMASVSGGISVIEDSTVFIGRKASMNYVLAVVTQFNTGVEMVTIKARGRAISKAVDVTEIVRNRFMKGLEVGDIKIGTVNIEDETREGGINVSWIELVLNRNPGKEGPNE